MRAYIVRRMLQFIPVLLGITFLVYSTTLMLPGDPVYALAGLNVGQTEFTPEQIERFREDLGLNDPIPVQYLNWLKNAAQGDFGESTRTRRPVTEEVTPRLKVTLQLSIASLLIATLIGLPAGVAAAIWRDRPIDRLITVVSVAGVAVPSFWLGIMMILLFSVRLEWLPPSGFVSVFEDPVRGMKLLVMPATILGAGGAAILTRQTRSAMLEVLNQDYIRTARAKGLSSRNVIWLHALKNAMLPIITILGLFVGNLLSGAAIVETIFAIPGLGRLLVASIGIRDFPVIQLLVLIVAVSTVVATLLTDVAYALLDPRIRYR
ncbi:MAG: ABC transporter permease [Chloroflexi bacterium CFX7]|nr:ABC transporter permease [Chloroflexi bacterium CFX7]MCK6565696.1 ABC transporter permease [Dehalococcoidia bacterium]